MLENQYVAVIGAAAGLLAGLSVHLVARQRARAEIRRLQSALEVAAPKEKATIAAQYARQIAAFSDGITQLREELQKIDIEIARQKRLSAPDAVPQGADGSAGAKLDRTLAKRTYLKAAIDGLAQRKVGWVEGEHLIRVAGYGENAWLVARREIDAELARIDAGQMELRDTAAAAIQEVKRHQRETARKSEVLDNQRHEQSVRTKLPE